MKRKNICSYCYGALEDEDTFFHDTCSLKFFGSKTPAVLSYSVSDLDRLAEEAVRSRITVPGV